MTDVEKRYVPPSHRPLDGPSNEVAESVDAEREARGPIKVPRSATQIERDIKARNERLIQTRHQLETDYAPAAIAGRQASHVKAMAIEKARGRKLEIAGAVVGVIVVVVALRALKRRL